MAPRKVAKVVPAAKPQGSARDTPMAKHPTVVFVDAIMAGPVGVAMKMDTTTMVSRGGIATFTEAGYSEAMLKDGSYCCVTNVNDHSPYSFANGVDQTR